MMVALLTSQRSPDPNTQVGACIVDNDNRLLATGYNGLPRGVSYTQIPWEREGEYHQTKYAYIVHAEKNAIHNAQSSLVNSTLFVTLYPCAECAKDIIQAGIRKIYYLDNKYKGTPHQLAAEKLFDLANIKIEQFQWWSLPKLKEALIKILPFSEVPD
jgi:dCMP deaminase